MSAWSDAVETDRPKLPEPAVDPATRIEYLASLPPVLRNEELSKLTLGDGRTLLAELAEYQGLMHIRIANAQTLTKDIKDLLLGGAK